jgi:hypothetical protein
VHDYVNIDTFMVFDIISNDLISLKNSLIKIVASQLNNGNFDSEEYNEARKSYYYRHVDFGAIENQPSL